MIGIPSTLNTALDYERMHELAKIGEVSKTEMQARWQGLLSTASAWEVSTKTPAYAAGKENFKVMESEESGKTVYEYKRLASAKIDELGYTEAQVQAFITELGE